jgi:hypothetical protein
MSSVAQEIKDQVEAVKSQVASGELSAADGNEILSELKSVQEVLNTAEAEIAVRYLVEAIEVLSKA